MIELGVLDWPTLDVSPATAEFPRLLAISTRRRILLALMQGETCNCEMVGVLGLAQNLMSHHLRQLRRAGLIRACRDQADQRWIYYSVDREVLGGIHRELEALFGPCRVGERLPRCGPAAQGC